MSADHKPDKHTAKVTAISVFGRGRTLRSLPQVQDKSLDREAYNAALELPRYTAARTWDSLNAVPFDAEVLARNKLFPNPSKAPAAAIFDILRTRILQALAEHGWRRVGITSPTDGCGKSFVAANLALSLARRPASRSVLMDLDLRKSDLAHLFGQAEMPPLAEFLSGEQPLEANFCRFGKTLALGLNGQAEADPGRILHGPDAAAALGSVLDQLEPEILLLDLPAALGRDDVIALQPQLDAVLIVVDGTHSSPAEIRACEALFQGRMPILGVVLNRGEDAMPGMKG